MRGKIMRTVMTAITLFLLPSLAFSYEVRDEAKRAEILERAGQLQVPFVENTGQIGKEDVRYYARTHGGIIFVDKNGALGYDLAGKGDRRIFIRESFAAKPLEAEAKSPSSTKVNYFKGMDERSWKTNISTYGSLSLGEIEDGIELELRAYGNNVEKLFTVLPGEDPARIKVEVEGIRELRETEAGELEMATEAGPFRFTRPVAYQEIGGQRKPVPVAYVVHEKKTYGFEVGPYDEKMPLVIDPLLASTYVGGKAADEAYAIAVDGLGFVYITGCTWGETLFSIYSDYPTTPGAYDTSYYDYTDVIVSKLDQSLNTLLASTFIGGDHVEIGYDIAVDALGNVYVTGYSASSGFPATSGAYDSSYNGIIDCFVAKLDQNLSTLLACTFIGGSSVDESYGIALDPYGNVYITGKTHWKGFPTTSGVYDSTQNGNWDCFVSKFNSDLSSLLASTYIGGSGYQWGNDIQYDPAGSVTIAGVTTSSSFPVVGGAYDMYYNGGYSDAFIADFNLDLTILYGCTYVGGKGDDESTSIALHGGKVTITGWTESSDFPTTSGSYDTSYNGNRDVFVTTLDNCLMFLLNSTFIGGNDVESGSSVAVDDAGNAYVTGYTKSSTYPTTADAHDKSHNGNKDVFYSKLDVYLTSLTTSTFLGGSKEDVGNAIAVYGGGNVYVTGMTASSNYPTTAGAYDQTFNGSLCYSTPLPGPFPPDCHGDVFISKLAEVAPDIKANGSDGPVVVTPKDSVRISISLQAGGTAGKIYEWWGVIMTWPSPPVIIPLGQSTLFDFPDTTLFDMPLPAGEHIFAFVLDDNPDGVFDMTWHDSVMVLCVH